MTPELPQLLLPHHEKPTTVIQALQLFIDPLSAANEFRREMLPLDH